MNRRSFLTPFFVGLIAVSVSYGNPEYTASRATLHERAIQSIAPQVILLLGQERGKPDYLFAAIRKGDLYYVLGELDGMPAMKADAGVSYDFGQTASRLDLWIEDIRSKAAQFMEPSELPRYITNPQQFLGDWSDEMDSLRSVLCWDSGNQEISYARYGYSMKVLTPAPEQRRVEVLRNIQQVDRNLQDARLACERLITQLAEVNEYVKALKEESESLQSELHSFPESPIP